MIKESWVTIRLSEEDKKELQWDARKQGRSVSNYLVWVWHLASKRSEKVKEAISRKKKNGSYHGGRPRKHISELGYGILRQASRLSTRKTARLYKEFFPENPISKSMIATLKRGAR